MNKLISKKKQAFPISTLLKNYLQDFGRWVELPITYQDLLRYSQATALYDKYDQDTLWITVSYNSSEKDEIEEGLLQIYSLLRGKGELAIIDHLIVDRIDLCLYGNTKPFRIRIINTLNDNFDYFYVKWPDASRIYGLELEHILSPFRISFLVNTNTLVEEHIYGIPGDIFINRYMDDKVNEVRIAKDFVKFNERCLIRLLGDMHSGNYVVDITLDVEENIYRFRAIDFDQQSYEFKRKIYQPQFFKENSKIVDLVLNNLTLESIRQYQHEEKSVIYKRMTSSRYRVDAILRVMETDFIAPTQHIASLGEELCLYYQDNKFRECKSMGALLRRSLERLDNIKKK